MTDFDRAKVEAFTCPKCGNADVHMLYHDEGEYLRIKCHRCEYRWSTKPLDALLAPPPSSAADESKRRLSAKVVNHHDLMLNWHLRIVVLPDDWPTGTPVIVTEAEDSEPKLESRADLHLTETQQEKEGLATTVPQPPAAIAAQGREP